MAPSAVCARRYRRSKGVGQSLSADDGGGWQRWISRGSKCAGISRWFVARPQQRTCAFVPRRARYGRLLFPPRQRVPVAGRKPEQSTFRQGLCHDGILLMASTAQGRQARVAAQFQRWLTYYGVSGVGVCSQRQAVARYSRWHSFQRMPPSSSTARTRRFLNYRRGIMQGSVDYYRSVRRSASFSRCKDRDSIVDNGAVAYPPRPSS